MNMRIRTPFLIAAGALVPLLASAALSPSYSIAKYIDDFYKFSLGIAGGLAFAMIVVGSLYYSLSGVADKKSQGKDFIVSAIYGLILLLGAYLILNTINPELTQLKDVGGLTHIATNLFEYTNPRAASECGDFSRIQLYTSFGFPVSSYTCSQPTIIYSGNEFSIGNDNLFYDETWAEKIASGTKLWVYPFYHTDLGTSSPRCIIYAYQSPPTREEVYPEWKSVSIGSIRRCSGTFPPQTASPTADGSGAASPPPAQQPAACSSPGTIYSPGHQRTLNCATEQQTSPNSTLSFSKGTWYAQDINIPPRSTIWVKPYYKGDTTACLIYKYNAGSGERDVALRGDITACSTP